MVAQYRFRGAQGVSDWMSGEQLREAAKRGEVQPDDDIQAAGRADWVSASTVKGLEFPQSEADPETAPATATGHHVKFSTIKEVLAAFLHGEVEIRTGREIATMHLAAVGVDHFETIDEESRRRLFVPFSRVRRLVAEETSQSAALNYRSAHRLSISVDGDG